MGETPSRCGRAASIMNRRQLVPRRHAALGVALVLLAALLLFPFVAAASSYEAPLPAQLSTDPDLCAHAPCQEVMPDADSFSTRKGKPAYVEAYRNRQLIGYVFLSTDIVDIPAYSGKPVVTLLGMDAEGKIVGVKILKHSEPILLVGIPESELTRFVKQFLGRFAWDKVEIGRARGGDGYIGIDAITGATVTVIAQNQVVMRSAYAIASQTGIVKPIPKPQAKLLDIQETLSWEELIQEGSVQHLRVMPKDLDGSDGAEPYIDLYFGYLNAPNVGRNILGERNYQRLMADLKPNEHAIFIVANGSGSFKGSGFVRGGIYDRIQVSQDIDSFSFRDTDYLNLYGINAAGAPRFRESGIFIIRSPGFSAAYPWSLVFLAHQQDPETGTKTFINFDQEYWLAVRYLEGGRPKIIKPDPTWLRVWKNKWLEITLFVLLLAGATATHVLRDQLARRAHRKDKRWVNYPKYFFWIVSVGFVGYYMMAQPSITHVLTWFHSLIYQWKWELFLSDPLIFIFWWFIIITTLIWGRGLFCGWLCPYGALTELAYKASRALGLKRFQFFLPKPLHDQLKWIKYGIFVVLLVLSFHSMGLAERMAEVEPFKTTFLVGVLNRSWPFVLFWVILLGASMFTERPFCKYLCPLGAGLAIPSHFRWLRLKRKTECQTCKACAVGCGSLAIDRQGRIDQRECLLCLDCMILYYDTHSCPPLSRERKRRERMGLPLTPISAQGYFIPVDQIGGRTVAAAGGGR